MALVDCYGIKGCHTTIQFQTRGISHIELIQSRWNTLSLHSVERFLTPSTITANTSNSMKTHHSINYLGFDLNKVKIITNFFVRPTSIIFHIVIHQNSCRSYSFYATTGFEKIINTSVTAGLLYRTFCQQLQGQFP